MKKNNFLRRTLLVLLIVVGLTVGACLATTPSSTITPAPVTDTSLPPVTNTPNPPTQATHPTLTSTPAAATIFPDPGNYTWKMVAQGLTRPVGLKSPGDGTGRLFIVEQHGRILILQNEQILQKPFLDIANEVGSSGNEQGLLGLAFHPNYAQSGFFFINYTDNNGNTVIARFHVSSDPNVADPSSETALLHVQQPFPNHNGGSLAFGPDGYLYAGLGDGGSGGDPYGNAQNTNVRLGKILRIDVDHGNPYAIPDGNPFPTGSAPEVWAYGLRNPWRFSFDKATGDLYIGDVGQDAWEEIDFLPAGSPSGTDFGWNLMEGNHPYKGQNQPNFTAPVAEYNHQVGGCAVTGGYVYRGAALPEWQGIYLYGDYCSGIVWGLIHSTNGWQSQVLFQTGFNISSFGQDESGELYIVDLKGAVYRLEHK
ncbi:MAG TPA: PQQ-dependent sugar dehydrogenase [Anaerolineales bacterium]|nr:PQQ-dependent sugar dehydrogenase [Anaerolineales bacterium]